MKILNFQNFSLNNVYVQIHSYIFRGSFEQSLTIDFSSSSLFLQENKEDRTGERERERNSRDFCSCPFAHELVSLPVQYTENVLNSLSTKSSFLFRRKNGEGSSISQTIRESFARRYSTSPQAAPLLADFIHFPCDTAAWNLLIPRKPSGERNDTGSGEIYKLERYKTYNKTNAYQFFRDLCKRSRMR